MTPKKQGDYFPLYPSYPTRNRYRLFDPFGKKNPSVRVVCCDVWSAPFYSQWAHLLSSHKSIVQSTERRNGYVPVLPHSLWFPRVQLFPPNNGNVSGPFEK